MLLDREAQLAVTPPRKTRQQERRGVWGYLEMLKLNVLPASGIRTGRVTGKGRCLDSKLGLGARR